MSSSTQTIWPPTAIGLTNTVLSPTVAAGSKWILDWITAHNTSTTTTATVTWYLVPSGGSAGSTTEMEVMTLLPGETKIPQGVRGHTMLAGGSVVAISTLAGTNTAATGRLQSTT
jgi:hypothetical protein